MYAEPYDIMTQCFHVDYGLSRVFGAWHKSPGISPVRVESRLDEY